MRLEIHMKENLFIHKQSGKDFNRPAWKRLIKKLRPGCPAKYFISGWNAANVRECIPLAAAYLNETHNCNRFTFDGKPYIIPVCTWRIFTMLRRKNSGNKGTPLVTAIR